MNSTATKGKRPRRATVLVAILAIAASGCAVNDALPDLAATDTLVTGSVVAPSKAKGVAETDAEIIKTTVANADSASEAYPLAWNNPETGSSGSIVAIDKFMGKHGQSCRGFKTTVASFAGVSIYNGETCQSGPGEWVLSWFKSTD